jgi:hypothetical protein
MRYNFRVNRDAGSFIRVRPSDVDDDTRGGLRGFLDGCAAQFVQVLARSDDVGGCLVHVPDLAAWAHGESRFASGYASDLVNVLKFGFDAEGGVDEIDA